VATRDVFSEEEQAQLRAFPEIGRVELIRHFTLTDADAAFLRRFRTGRDVLGAALQLTTVRFLGTFLDDPLDVPEAVAEYLAGQLGIRRPGVVRDYIMREMTRFEHLRQTARRTGSTPTALTPQQAPHRPDKRRDNRSTHAVCPLTSLTASFDKIVRTDRTGRAPTASPTRAARAAWSTTTSPWP
jgi:Domain of unknown function (DUF4158)